MSCWHNTSVSEDEPWLGWRATYLHMVEKRGSGADVIWRMESAELTLVNLILWQFAAVVKSVTPSAMVATGHTFWAAWGITSVGASSGSPCSAFWEVVVAMDGKAMGTI